MKTPVQMIFQVSVSIGLTPDRLIEVSVEGGFAA